jgi:hypothetical protein
MYEVIFSDGISQRRKFKHEIETINFMKREININKKLREIAIYKKDIGFHSTTQTKYVVKFWGNGSYLDNVSKRDTKLATKKIN